MSDGQATETPTSESRKAKRPRTTDESRKRTARACITCRKLKDKCEGGIPCRRCIRLRRPCHIDPPPNNNSTLEEGQDTGVKNGTRQPGSPKSHGQERVHYLEEIARHFLGDVSLDTENLRSIAEKLKDRRSEPLYGSPGFSDTLEEELSMDHETFAVNTLSNNTAHYSGDFSHWNFSQKIHRRLRQQLNDGDPKHLSPLEYWRATHLQLPPAVVSSSISFLPPLPIAEFLTEIFFKYVQNNYFFVEETWLKGKLKVCYEQPSEVSASDASWVCSVLMILAIGTQFAHMEAQDSGPLAEDLSFCSEDNVGITFYHTACRLIPDVITLASLESVQACLLLAEYTLPLDTHGLAYTYLGLAIKMAIQNGMHRKYTGNGFDERTIETRNRLWWTSYSLERRISVMHGRPASLCQSETDADFPRNTFPNSPGRPSNFQNMAASIQLHVRLGDIATTIKLLRKCPKRLKDEYFGRMLQIRERLFEWWITLPDKIDCRDLNPEGPLFRHNCHLTLCFLLCKIYMGRPFLFCNVRPDEPGTVPSRVAPQSLLVKDCVESALEIVNLLQFIQDHCGLCRASYTEFSSCRVALLVIIAQSINKRTKQLRDASTQGMKLIKLMTGGMSTYAELSLIESLQAAMNYLDSQAQPGAGAETERAESGYDRFKSWARFWKQPSSGLETTFSPQSTSPTLPDGDGLALRDPNAPFTHSPQTAGVYPDAFQFALSQDPDFIPFSN
ncbi:hypothetical protein ASPZODRAFT_132928 [Penicilliopsis zonata CBS 506.65]|uniref:Zn(2)-C6 fungal-type domain-containing protein n=1 Tax=Penicilliopsis zonata CBS 506.65 TaxID=1073090 RepID=A0A1L9SI46_9EURO|nr:hypothetical protein ASPZODRAFT_132928 [Penicilliopsis zonata CBS 506.65]OJJ46776.1 hypothetical protein ASPZODRAFT_132928 [Penicilliopsis zonata CBS 506.65]